MEIILQLTWLAPCAKQLFRAASLLLITPHRASWQVRALQALPVLDAAGAVRPGAVDGGAAMTLALRLEQVSCGLWIAKV